ncbi:UNVERIFIED_CONTAM: ATP-dependent DNA helicase Q-like 1 [Sesamum radiatum]|uniref:ATP-dependent DNA helicase Q-like 1 n=1 Tax=Sesamum radiatum TaxID=300843 RepID=A0AAW2RX74_SESRA
MDDQDMELEKARLISLALEFGFDEASANRCLDRLVQLYGELFPVVVSRRNLAHVVPVWLCFCLLRKPW